MYITDIVVNDGRKSAFFSISEVAIKRVYIYIPHCNHTFRFIVFIGLVYNGILFQGLM